MKLKNKSKVEVFLSDEVKEKLKVFCAKKDCSMAEAIKRALDLYLN